MAIPRRLLAKNVPLGEDSFEQREISLFAAAANSQTTYKAGDRLLFQIPNYARSFVDWKKSYLKFDVKLTEGGNKVRMCDGLPIFERLQLRVGSKSIEDIDSYYTLEKVLSLVNDSVVDKKNKMIYGDYNSASSTANDELIRTAQKASMPYIKKLYSGVISYDYLFPVHRLTSGSMVELELTLADNNVACSQVGSTVASGFSYEIGNVKFELCLLKVSDAFFNKFSSLANSNELVLPMTTYRRHISSFNKSNTTPVIFINDNAKNLKRTWSVFTEPVTVSTTQKPDFTRGASESDGKLVRYQYKYMSRSFPESPVEANGDDQNIFLSHLLTNSGNSLTEKMPYIASFADAGVNTVYHDNLILAQDFTYSDDDIINGLNINASGSPLILELKFNNFASTPSGNTNIETFSESSLDLVLDQYGNASIVQNTKMSVE